MGFILFNYITIWRKSIREGHSFVVLHIHYNKILSIRIRVEDNTGIREVF